MTGWLAGLDRAELARVLANRPDVLLAPEPRNLTELSDRLGGGADSLVTALRGLPVPCVQVVEAAMALGGSATLAELTEILSFGQRPAEHGEHVAHWVQVLTDHGIVWLDATNVFHSAQALAALFPSPLGLGPPVRTLLPDTPADLLRRMLSALGRPKPPTRRAEVVAEIERILTDPQQVRQIVDTAPSSVAQELLAWASEGQRPEGDDDDYFDDEDDDALVLAASYDPAAHTRRRAAAMWGIERGLVFGQSWSYEWRMPAEVSRALRGPQFRAPFTAVPPIVDVTKVDSARQATQSEAAVSRFADLVLALVDRLARTPLPALKSGGVGARELAKLGKAIGGDDAEIRLSLELCSAVDVLEIAAGLWQLSAKADDWRSLPPANRVATILAAWWELPRAATQSRDNDGKVTPALTASPPCMGCLSARQNLLVTMAELGEDEAGDPGQLGNRALWRRPFVHILPQDAREPFRSVATEATLLGVVAAGSLTPLGRALVAGQQQTVHELLVAALPAANDRALFGADHTVVVAGAPTTQVSRLLDSAADRESRGGATVWRFSPGSIRRALDEGQSAARLEQALAEIATSELPQSLRYLIGDVGRRHGSLKVAAAVSIVRSDDEALLAQVAADRALRKFGLRLLAPTVLSGEADADTVLSALRKAGYLPMPENAAGADTPSPGTQDQSVPDTGRLADVIAFGRSNRRRPASADPDLLAARLLAQPSGPPATPSRIEQQLGNATRLLSASELRILAHAIEHHGPVTIDYQSQSGGMTRREIVPREFGGSAILAWCELRADERWFRVERIYSVVPSG